MNDLQAIQRTVDILEEDLAELTRVDSSVSMLVVDLVSKELMSLMSKKIDIMAEQAAHKAERDSSDVKLGTKIRAFWSGYDNILYGEVISIDDDNKATIQWDEESGGTTRTVPLSSIVPKGQVVVNGSSIGIYNND